MTDKLEFAANHRRPVLPQAGLHLAVIATGEVVLMDDQNRIIAGVRSLKVEAEMQDVVSVTVNMLVVKPPAQ